MDTEDFVVNYGREAQVIENLSAVAPNINRSILAQALVIKTIDLSDLARFVVPADQSDPVWIAHLRVEDKFVIHAVHAHDVPSVVLTFKANRSKNVSTL